VAGDGLDRARRDWCIALGGAAGIAVAYWIFRSLIVSLPTALARTTAPVFDARVFAFAATAAAVAGILSSLLPAWRLARADMKSGLERGRLHTHPLRTGPRALLSIELGLALVSVVAAVILAQSLWALVSRELGFDARRLVVSAWTVSAGAANRDRPARLAEFTSELDAIRTIPAIRSVAATYTLPASGAAAEFPLFPRGQGRGGVWTISAGFFRTMGVRVIEGREFEERESFTAAPVAVLNESAARALFPDGHAIGREVRAPLQPARTVVGIAADWRKSLKVAAEPAMYVPFDRTLFRMGQAIVDADDTPAVREQIRAAITRVSPDSDIRIEPIAALLDRDVAVLRFTMSIISAFALLTVALAMLGVYGVITFISGERLREYGVRVALGATRPAIGLLVLRQAVIPMAAGLIAGSLAAVWTARVLAAQILDVAPASVTTFIMAAVGLFVCGVLAASVPARRATRVDPMIALRAE